jgi:phosphopantothenoylcysteine decarboxylase / phosphopantothenate---cysteine ligase
LDTNKGQGLKGKRILVTAGPTWIAIDDVRVLSNLASGQTGVILAERLALLGAKVTLLLGPSGITCLKKGVRVLNFRFFDELARILNKELKLSKYDFLVHSAAVSDYRPLKKAVGKVKSGRKNWRLDLVPTEKLINRLKAKNKGIYLVGFKFEPAANQSKLILSGRKLLQNSGADLVVANTSGKYTALLLENKNVLGKYSSKRAMVGGLIEAMGRHSCRG